MIAPNLQVTVAVALDEIENNSLPNKLKLKYDSHSYNNGENMLAMAAKEASMLSYSFIFTSSFGVDLVRESFCTLMNSCLVCVTEDIRCIYTQKQTHANTATHIHIKHIHIKHTQSHTHTHTHTQTNKHHSYLQLEGGFGERKVLLSAESLLGLSDRGHDEEGESSILRQLRHVVISLHSESLRLSYR